MINVNNVATNAKIKSQQGIKYCKQQRTHTKRVVAEKKLEVEC